MISRKTFCQLIDIDPWWRGPITSDLFLNSLVFDLDKDVASKNLEGLHIGVPMALNLKVQDVDIVV